jgi:hypothetical protein
VCHGAPRNLGENGWQSWAIERRRGAITCFRIANRELRRTKESRVIPPPEESFCRTHRSKNSSSINEERPIRSFSAGAVSALHQRNAGKMSLPGRIRVLLTPFSPSSCKI